MSEEKKNILHMMYDKDGYPTWQTQLSPEENKTRATCCVPPDQVMPVVFIPGIMGSNLKFIKKLDWLKDNIAWRPDDGYYTGITFGNLKPAKRRQVLDPKNTVLDESGEIPNSIIRFFKNVSPNVQTNWKKEFTRRGWGAINLDSYGEILCNLEWNLNHIFDPHQKASDQGYEVAAYWQKDVLGVKSTIDYFGKSHHPWGELNGHEALSHDDLKEKVGDKYWFPVYAAGYNWLHSNEEAGTKLAEKIQGIIKHYQALKFDCKQVILVTHSMGGLAARAACHHEIGKLEKLKLVAGVVHGEQPALGAAAAYKRMHAGFEAGGTLKGAAIARALGWSGKEVTAVLANARGGLELLPTKRYPKGWLKIFGTGRKVLQQMPEANPYKEIYAERDKWWRLMNPEWIEPQEGPPLSPGGLERIWDDYLDRLDLVETFHDKLGNYYHETTHAHYGADDTHMAWTNVTWGGVWGEDARGGASAKLVEDKTDGKIVVTNPSYVQQPQIFSSSKPATTTYVLSDPDLPGDGTVPECSGADSASKAKFSAKMTGYDHQGSYMNKAVKDVTAYSVARIAKDAK